jgi:microcystin-dependent protein
MPYIGEIRIVANTYAPAGWMLCEGQLLPISENDTLFVVLGTTYGGDGQETFALPDFRGRIPVHFGNGVTLAETGGVEEVTLTINNMPAHSHAILGSSAAGQSSNPGNNVLATPTGNIYNPGTNMVNMGPQGVAPVGGSQPHTNFQPYLCLNYIISLFGVFPSQT